MTMKIAVVSMNGQTTGAHFGRHGICKQEPMIENTIINHVEKLL